MRLGWKHPEPEGWIRSADEALKEDLGSGDLAAALLDPDHTSHWFIESQGSGVICGLGIALHLLTDPEKPDRPPKLQAHDGEKVEPGERLIDGLTRSAFMLSRERTVLNFLMMLSGTASLTRQFVDAVAGTKVQIVDTRKTVPGLRTLQKYAVRCGGGKNHRMGLYDGLLIKDNHIRAAGSITEAINRARHGLGHMVPLEVECEKLSQVDEALKGGAQIIMLDNMSLDEMQEAVSFVKGRALLEASGGVTLDRAADIARTGVDIISIGALTHSAASLALHLEIE